MAFIHGEARWSDDRTPIEADVQRMCHAVESQVTARKSSLSCALATQWFAKPAAQAEPSDRSDDETLFVAHDLQIHDAESVRRVLGLASTEYRGLTTSAIIERLYRSLGFRGFGDLVAEGTFAIWDARHDRLLLWRDAAGTRPLYYHHQPGERLVFSSDLRSLAAHRHVPAMLDLEFTRTVLETGQFHHPTRTLRRHITKLPGGHMLVADGHSFEVRQYWNPEQLAERRHSDRYDYVTELRELLMRAVADRIPDDPRTIACHLTGGLDSSTIAVMAQRAVQRNAAIRGISWAPPEELVPARDHDERPLARAVAREAGIDLHFTTPVVAERMSALLADQSLTPTTTLQWECSASRRAAEAGITTILSGWGGDELSAFNGRGYFADLARRGHWLRLVRELRLRRSNVGLPLIAGIRGSVVTPLLSDRALRRLRPGLVPEPALPSVLSPDFAAALRRVDAVEQTNLRTRPGVRRMQLTLLSSGHMPYRAESWTAHGADAGISYSYPLLDRRIIEFALGIPADLYFRDGWKRWIFREAASGVLPEEVRLNPHKFDSMAAAGMRTISQDVRQRYREALLERRTNPYLDVDKVLDPAWPKAPFEQDATWLAFVRDLPCT